MCTIIALLYGVVYYSSSAVVYGKKIVAVTPEQTKRKENNNRHKHKTQMVAHQVRMCYSAVARTHLTLCRESEHKTKMVVRNSQTASFNSFQKKKANVDWQQTNKKENELPKASAGQLTYC